MGYNIRPNTKEYWNFIANLPPITSHLHEVLVGLVLGDINLQTRNGGRTYSARFEYGD
jgi:hypothetical protein